MNIKIENLSFGYDNETPVLQNVNLDLCLDGICSLIGPNGAGKSSFFKCILNLNKLYSGNIFIDDEKINVMSFAELSKIIAYVPQKMQDIRNYKVIDIILMGFSNVIGIFSAPDKEQLLEARRMMEKLNIGYLSEKMINELSGGEQQLVLLCRALIQKAKIILMDEPFSNLDFANQIRVMEVLKEISDDGISVIYSTHNPNDMLQNSDYVIALKNGALAASGKTKDVVTEKMLSDLYDMKIKIIKTDDAQFVKRI